MAKDQSPKEVLARNARALKKAEGLTERQIATRTGLSQKTVNNVLNGKGGTVDTLELFAAGFGIAPWALLMPDVGVDLMESNDLADLYGHYKAADAEGRDLIARVAQRARRAENEPA